VVQRRQTPLEAWQKAVAFDCEAASGRVFLGD
jgi:hypothetical protein